MRVKDHNHELQRTEKIPSKLDGYTLIQECANCDYRLIQWQADKQDTLEVYQ